MSAGGPPSGVVTFLFTDIEGSTRRWESDADGMRVALAAHDKALRSAIEAYEGFLFSHTGDGVAAAFASPKSAVDAAVAAQRVLELPVRMGIATGEAELRNSDYFGTVLNRAARVMAAGHGGQVLVADSTAVLLSGVELQDLGQRRLRDVPTPIIVFQLKAPGLRTDFPPLRTLESSPGNLRRVKSNLVGRDAEIGKVETALRSNQFVTLTGVGGVGKTRLALAVATHMAEEFADGVWVFELAAVADPAAVPDAVAAVMGITQQPGKTVSESVTAALEGRVRLLLFDNCEHVVDAAADLVDAIRAQSTTVRILATSREGLGVDDERLVRVPSLDVAASVELFEQRADSLLLGESTAVEEICRRLDGIPLAIELAASRMVSMTAAEVRDRLDDRFRLLVGSRRGLERHQTLRHAVAWSYDLLDDAERALLDRCSVFAGGFDLQSACAVAGFDDVDDYAVLDLLDALVRKSLLIADRTSGRTRFSMLETIRQFAEEQLVASDAAEEVRAAHARHFAGLGADILALWDSPRQRDAYTWFSAELANLRTAFRWAADHSDLDLAIAISTHAAFIGQWVAHFEPTAWAEELVEPARAVEHPGLAAIYVMASQCYMTGRFEAAVRYSEAAHEVVRSRPGELPYGAEGFVGGAFAVVGRPERWIEWCRAALTRGSDAHAYTKACLLIGLTIAGDNDGAMAEADGLLEAAEAADNPYVLSFALLADGMALHDTDPVRSLESLRRGLVIAHDSGNRANESHLAANLCRLEAEHGDPLAALDYFAMAIRTYHDSGNIPMIHSPLGMLAAFFDRLGRSEPAATIVGFALVNPLAATAFPEIGTAAAHLRHVLGDQIYEARARDGETMTPSAVAAYAYDQIDQARMELEDVR